MFFLFWFIPCSISNRIRGGWLSIDIKEKVPFWSTTVARLSFSSIVSFPVFCMQPLKTSLTFYILFYIGLIFGWSPWQYMAKPLRDILILTARGLLLTVPCGFVCDLYYFAFSGSLMGISYWIAYQLPFKYIDRDWYPWIGSDWGELTFGGVLGLFIGINIYIL